MTTPLLEVEDLRIRFPARQGVFEAVRGVSFQMGRERLGIVGESGSGKSLTGRALLGLVPRPGRVTAARLAFQGQALQGLSERRFRALRGRHMTMVMQDPRYSLNPVMRVGQQIEDCAFLRVRLLVAAQGHEQGDGERPAGHHFPLKMGLRFSAKAARASKRSSLRRQAS